MRKTPSKLVVAVLVIATTAFGSWLLLADAAGLGVNQKGRRGRASVRHLARPASHGYGGYGGVCINGSLRALSAPQSFIHRGRLRCFASTGSPSGDNADLSTDVFVVDNQGNVSNMTKDTRRCVEGPNNGNSCTTFTDCPQGQCEDTNVSACTADARGHFVYFIFDGNPTGKNPDLGDELFAFDTRTHQLTQLTTQHGWCNNNPAQACDRSADCTSSICARARMTGTQSFGRYGGGSSSGPGLEVSPDGDIVWFITDGDPGGNPSHAVTQFALAVTGAQKGLRAVASAGKFCGSQSKHPGTPCASADDCRPICGDGIVDPGEQCEPFHLPPCPSGTFCRSPGFPDGCTCVLPVCGNGVLEPGEVCDGFSGGCFPPRHCNANCSRCSPSGAFLDVTP